MRRARQACEKCYRFDKVVSSKQCAKASLEQHVPSYAIGPKKQRPRRRAVAAARLRPYANCAAKNGRSQITRAGGSAVETKLPGEKSRCVRRSRERTEMSGYSNRNRGGEMKGYRRCRGSKIILEVGPRHDLVTFSSLCVELNGNTQAADSHWSLCAKALDGLQETPSRYSTQFDIVLVQHARSANNTPPVVEALHDRQPFPCGNDEFVGENRVKNLMDLSSVRLGRRGDRRGHRKPDVVGLHT